jgi:hypothetical protein
MDIHRGGCRRHCQAPCCTGSGATRCEYWVYRWSGNNNDTQHTSCGCLQTQASRAPPPRCAARQSLPHQSGPTKGDEEVARHPCVSRHGRTYQVTYLQKAGKGLLRPLPIRTHGWILSSTAYSIFFVTPLAKNDLKAYYKLEVACYADVGYFLPADIQYKVTSYIARPNSRLSSPTNRVCVCVCVSVCVHLLLLQELCEYHNLFLGS